MAEIRDLTLVSTTSSSISVCISGLSTSYTNPPRTVTWKLNNSVHGYMTIPNGVTQSDIYTFSGLSPSTTYAIMGELLFYNADGSVGNPNNEPYYYSGSYTTNISESSGGVNDNPSYIYWQQRYKGNAFDLTATEWNALTSNINDVRVYKGLYSYGFTTAYTGQPLTADMYNQCIYAMRDMSYGIGTLVSRGDTVTADLINVLPNFINSLH